MRLLFLSLLLLFCSGCATYSLWNAAMTTTTDVYIPVKDKNNIRAFKNASEIILQYDAIPLSSSLAYLIDKTEVKTRSNEAEYDLNTAVKLEHFGDNICLVAPKRSDSFHSDISTKNNWAALTVKYDYSQYDKKNRPFVRGVPSSIYDSIERCKENIEKGCTNDGLFIKHLIENVNCDKTSLQVILLPLDSLLDYSSESTKYYNYRGMVFFKVGKDEKMYILMFPHKNATYGHSAKLLLFFIPATIALDIATSPVQIPAIIFLVMASNALKKGFD